MWLPQVCFIYLSNSLKNICYLLFNVLQSISINYILVGSVCVQRNFFKANCVEASFIRSLDSNLSSQSYIRWTSIGSRNSSVGRALDWRSKGPWFDPGFRQKLRRLPLQFFQLLFHFVNTPSTVQIFDSCTSRLYVPILVPGFLTIYAIMRLIRN